MVEISNFTIDRITTAILNLEIAGEEEAKSSSPLEESACASALVTSRCRSIYARPPTRPNNKLAWHGTSAWASNARPVRVVFSL